MYRIAYRIAVVVDAHIIFHFDIVAVRTLVDAHIARERAVGSRRCRWLGGSA